MPGSDGPIVTKALAASTRLFAQVDRFAKTVEPTQDDGLRAQGCRL